MRTDDQMREHIAAGVAWLDETRGPGWIDKVDLDTLNLMLGCSCVLGQLWLGDYPESHRWDREDAYPRALAGWAGQEPYTDETREWAAARGFTSLPGAGNKEWAPLTALWVETIEKLRANA